MMIHTGMDWEKEATNDFEQDAESGEDDEWRTAQPVAIAT